MVDISLAYTQHYKRLLYISFSITKDHQIAEDIVQEAFIKAMKKTDTLQDERKVGSWLSAIAARTAIDYIRSEKRKKGIPMEKDFLEVLGGIQQGSIEAEVEAKTMAAAYSDAIKRLPQKYQNVLLLKVNTGLKEHEIAAVLQMNLTTVKTNIFRARKQLKTLLPGA